MLILDLFYKYSRLVDRNRFIMDRILSGELIYGGREEADQICVCERLVNRNRSCRKSDQKALEKTAKKR